MPELPEVEAVRRRLERAMRGTTIARVLLRRANLRRPFPEGFASRLEGQTIRSLRRRGKYLLLDLSSGDVLLIHLGMSGSFRIDEDELSQRSRPRRLPALERFGRHLQRSETIRPDGRHPGGRGR